MNQKLQDQKHVVYSTDGKSQYRFASVSQAHRATGHTKKAILKSIKTGENVTKQVNYKFIDG